MDLLSTGITSLSRQKVERLIEHIRKFLNDHEEDAKRGIRSFALC